MRFELVVRSPAAGTTVRAFDAADATAARERAAAEGLQVIGTARAGTGWARRAPATWGGAALDHGALAEELGTLLGAGLGVLEAVDALLAGGGGEQRRAVLAALAQALKEGHSLSDAFERTGAFPVLFVAAVRASERTGDLAETLLRHAEHQRRVARLRARVAGAATYPLILLAVGTVVVLFLLGFVVPRFASLIETTRADLPLASRWLMQWGAAMAAHPQWLATSMAALLAAAFAVVRRLRAGHASAWLQRLPVFGALVRLYRQAQLYRSAGVLVRGGVPALQALQQCLPLLPGPDRAALERAVQRLREGIAFSVALAEAGLADAVSTRMLLVAERTGTLPAMLERIAARLETRLEAALDSLGRWIEPLLMIAIGLVIGAIVVLMYLPIFDLASQLQ